MRKIPKGDWLDMIETGNEIANAGWQFRHFEATNSIVLPYQIYIPNGYSEEKKYPVLLFMHGMGSVGCNGEHISQPVAEYLRVVTGSEYRDNVIIIAPQLPKGHTWVNIGAIPTDGTYDYDSSPITAHLEAAVELFEVCFDNMPIDMDRVYGYGNSMGAFATLYLACRYPDLYAAIVPVAGGCDPNTAERVKHIPMWLFHGDADKTVNIKGSRAIVEAANALGATDARLTVFEGVGHHAQNCFVAAARTEGLCEWMFSHIKAR